MFYKRADLLPLTRRLTREELRIITACRNKVDLETIVNKTKLEQTQVIKVMNSFITEGLIRPFTSLGEDQVTSLKKPRVENLPEEPSSKINKESKVDELLERLESILIARLPEKKAKGYIEELHLCSSEEDLRAKAQAISKKIALIVNASAGKELMLLLDY